MGRSREVLTTAAEAADVIVAYQSGQTMQQIADHYGCSTRPVRRILEEASVGRRRRNERYFSADQRAQIAQAYRDGTSIEALAARNRRDVRTIHRLLHEAGVPRRPVRGHTD